MHSFSFMDILMHSTDGESVGKFVRRYSLFYGLLYTLFALIFTALAWPFVSAIFESMLAYSSGDFLGGIQIVLEGYSRSALVVMAFIPASVAMWATFECALQRYYMRGEGFRVSFGADEWRLVLVGFSWVGIASLAYLVSAFLVVVVYVIAGGIGGREITGFLIGFFGGATIFLFWIWFVTRLAPAAAITIRDKKYTFFGAFKATEGRFLTMMAAYTVTLVASTLIYLLLRFGYNTFFQDAVQFTTFGGDLSAMMAPEKLYQLIGYVFISSASMGVFQYFWATPAVLAARTEPGFVEPGYED